MVYGNIEMRSMVNTNAVFNKQNLRGFVLNAKVFGNKTGYGPVVEEIKIKRLDITLRQVPVFL
jgi:hypothetical protein